MFNALNALSENSSLLVQRPWCNPWLLGAIALSMVRVVPSTLHSCGRAGSVIEADARIRYMCLIWSLMTSTDGERHNSSALLAGNPASFALCFGLPS